ncbi:MAG: amidohydrolase [Bacteroidetes bacterium]|nr:amidohydrolase [Bacteroidota bacterium]
MINNMINNTILKQLVDLRKILHQHPELSNNEIKTSIRITSFLRKLKPNRIAYDVGGNGLIAEFKGKEPGPTLMFRCELDALPIAEKNEIAHKSIILNAGHLCGHDGHMVMLVGLAYLLSEYRPQNGSVVLLFQPSEEDGKGAERVLNDPLFKDFEPDYIFAIHNLPGYSLHKVVLSKGNFAAASTGMRVQITGKSSHAAEPEKGNNPGFGMAQMIIAFQDILKIKNYFRDYNLITPIHVRLGNIAYGTTPGEGVIHLTLRSFEDTDMEMLKQELEGLIKTICIRENLTYIIKYEEVFPSTVNDPECSRIIEKSAIKEDLPLIYINEPFKWSEDFGHFTAQYPGALFGLGSGIDQPALHNPNFDFPDTLITTGVKLYMNICQQILNF